MPEHAPLIPALAALVISQSAMAEELVSPRKAFAVRTGLEIGAGNESMGGANLGFSEVGEQTPRLQLGGVVTWQSTVERGFELGLRTDLAFSALGSGWERTGAVMGYHAPHFGVDLDLGVSGEPAAPRSGLSGVPYAAVEARYLIDAPVIPGKISFGAQGAMDFSRLPGVSGEDFSVALRVGWEAQWPVSTTRALQVDKSPRTPRLVTSSRPLDLNVVLPTPAAVVDPLDRGTAEQLKGEIADFALRNAYAGVEDIFLRLMTLRDEKGVVVDFDAYKRGAEAARQLGYFEDYYQRLQWAHLTNPKDAEVSASLEDLKRNFAYVSMKVDAKHRGPDAFVTPDFFNPEARNVSAVVLEAMQTTGQYEGFLPVMDANAPVTGYSLCGVPIAPKPFAEDSSVQVFILR